MARLVVIIEDRIRGEHERVSVDPDTMVPAIIEQLVRRWGLPRRDFLFDEIDYSLLRQPDDSQLPDHVTLRELGVRDDDSLALVSPEGKRVWDAIQRLLDEIESEIKDRIKSEVRKRIHEKLEDIAKTQAQPEKLSGLADQLADVGEPPLERPRTPEPGRSGTRRPSLARRLLTISVLVVILVITTIVLVSDGDESPEVQIVAAKAMGFNELEDGCIYELEGDGTDAEDGNLPEEAFQWRTDRTDLQGEFLGSGRVIPTVLRVVFGESRPHVVTLTVRDSDGNTASDSRSVNPEDCF